MINRIKKRARPTPMEGSPFVIGILVVLSISIGILLYLLFWAVTTSLKSSGEFYRNKLWLPSGHIWEWEWKNFTYVITSFKLNVFRTDSTYVLGFAELAFNGLYFAIGPSVVHLMVACFMAYLTQRFTYKFSKVLNTGVLIVMIIPLYGTLSGTLAVLKTLNIYDTFFSIFLMRFSFTDSVYLILYAAFSRISRDYEEAAYIDGASELTVYIKIMLPMVWNLCLIFILQDVVGQWNNWSTPLYYLPTHPTLAYGVYTLTNSTIQGFNRTPAKLATCFLASIPCLILFVIFRDKFTSNELSMGGIKG